MAYRLRCTCGAGTEVMAGAAGTRVPCPCGRVLGVPPLSVLRSSEGVIALTEPDACSPSAVRPGPAPSTFLEADRRELEGKLPNRVNLSALPTMDYAAYEMRCGWCGKCSANV